MSDLTSTNTGSLDLCPGCRRFLDLIQIDVVRRTDGVIELIFCVCGTALDVRVASIYLTGE